MTTLQQLVSVIIPCYNQGRFLGEAIESVLAQTHPHFEIIVVDDGSTDDTSEVAARYPHVRCIRQNNQGRPALTRNRGLPESKGDYVVFLDADDRLLPDALEVGLGHLDAHPECAFVSGLCRKIRSDGSLLPNSQSGYVEKSFYSALLTYNYISIPATVLYRRAIFDSVDGFNTSWSVKGSEDYELYLRIAKDSPICSHNKVIADYRQHDASLSHNADLMMKSTLTVLRSHRDHAKGNKEYQQSYRAGMKSWKEYYGELLIGEVRACVRTRRDWKQALRSMFVLLRFHPSKLVKHAYQKAYCSLAKPGNSLRFSKGEVRDENIVSE